FVAHTDSLFDPEILRRYLRAYQEVQPLTIGELWAVAITLRIVLIENLRRIANRIVDSGAGRRAADALADRLLGAGGRAPEPSNAVLPQHAETTYPDALLVQLAYRLRDQDPSIAPALEWLDRQLARQGTTADAVIHDEHQRQVTSSVTVRNIITSMRLISDVDWTELFERVSLVDEVFRGGSRFAEMDFPTRNLYRTAVEQLARGSGFTELEVAEAAVVAARPAYRADTEASDARLADPGYYLIAAGQPGFEAQIGFKPSPRAWPGRFYRALGIGGYVSAGAVVAAGLLAIPLSVVASSGVNWRWLPLLAILGLVPAIDAAVALVNRVVTWGFRATLLPALELRGGIPQHLRTLVAVPTLLTSPEDIEEQIGRLEIHYLASPPGDLHFALLSDWTDAASEQAEGDEELLAATKEGIASLNKRYGPAPGGDRFLLLHRRRVWTPGEGRWIGWERKRGKLTELNRLLRGAQDTTFLAQPALPADIRYVITLDADTRLPRETVGRLIGKMAHPLNRPRFDTVLGRVVEGYGILQPRVTPALPVGREGSLFLRVFSSATGIPLCSRGLGCVPGFIRRGHLHGQGHLRRRRFRSGDGRPSAGICSPQPRPFRGDLRPCRPDFGRGSRGGFPGPLRRCRPSPPPLGARRLAASALGFRTGASKSRSSAARRRPCDWPLEDARQPSAVAVAAIGRHGPDRGMGLALARCCLLDGFHLIDDHFAASDSGDCGYRAAPTRRGAPESFPRLGSGNASCAYPVGPDDGFGGASSLADG
ncbi:MAG: hypothetical protein ACLPLP_02915, partial [Mycobacterium sp.]